MATRYARSCALAMEAMPDYVTVHPLPAGWLPDDWIRDVETLAAERGTQVKTQGRGPGSLESDETAGLDYRVVTGSTIHEHAPWLWNWYTGEPMVNLMTALVGEEVAAASWAVESAININHLSGADARYELHVDGQPYSAVMMLTECDSVSGGRLLLGSDADLVKVDTKPGMLVVFDGSVIPHAVEPMRRPTPPVRISIPMVYTPVRLANARPKGLDSYLYGTNWP